MTHWLLICMPKMLNKGHSIQCRFWFNLMPFPTHKISWHIRLVSLRLALDCWLLMSLYPTLDWQLCSCKKDFFLCVHNLHLFLLCMTMNLSMYISIPKTWKEVDREDTEHAFLLQYWLRRPKVYNMIIFPSYNFHNDNA